MSSILGQEDECFLLIYIRVRGKLYLGNPIAFPPPFLRLVLPVKSFPPCIFWFDLHWAFFASGTANGP
ncbi:hypothetical protein DPMN_064070 [Dreissena polymorpha]|uniref:Uncharacterized protein n=1 Tax=Dreissena polymorpha TaxID=45954 RepID=A0A9D4CCZ5_DREPO|nr:hypothetical protein DPMN_064070 [Dreissena polymorpha]